LKTVSLHSTLAELGMDSMMAVEIKQTLEREFEVFLTAQDIRSLTFAKLQDIAKARDSDDGSKPKENLISPTELREEALRFLMRSIGAEDMASKPVVHLPSKVSADSKDQPLPVFMVPGIEGMASMLTNLASHIKAPVHCLQIPYNDVRNTRIEDFAKALYPHLKSRLSPGKPFRLLGYSFGGVVSIELVRLLEKDGFTGTLVLVDGAPAGMKSMTNQWVREDNSTLELEVAVLMGLLLEIKVVPPPKLREDLLRMPTWESRLDHFLAITPNTPGYTKEHKKNACISFLNRTLAVHNYVPEGKLTTPVTLIRPSTITFTHKDDDYGVSEYFEQESVPVHFVDGDHITVLDNTETSTIINSILESGDKVNFGSHIKSDNRLGTKA